MELRRLRYFAAVADAGSYRAAAERLHVAQPALWQQVQALQRELGLQLFERSGRAIRVSRAGSLLLEQTKRVLAEAEGLRLAADDLRSGRSGVVAIACYTPHLEHFLAPVIGRFQTGHPDVRVEIVEFAATGGHVAAIPASVASLMTGQVDLAVGPRPAAGATGFVIDESRIVLLVGPDHRWAGRRGVPLTALRDEPLLVTASRDSFSRSAIEQACHAAGFEPTIRLESRSSSALAALAENGVGVAVLPDRVVPSSFGGVGIDILGGGDILRREAWLCWREGGLQSPVVAAFIREARHWMRRIKDGIEPPH